MVLVDATKFTAMQLSVFKDSAVLVGLCDNNLGRAKLSAEQCAKKGVTVPVYAAAAFADMVRETRADMVIVTAKDCLHAYYSCAAMELGCDVISEKPWQQMPMDAEKFWRHSNVPAKTFV